MTEPIVLVSSYPPRSCGIAAFCHEAREFLRKHNPDREVLVISHTDGRGEGVFPILDPGRDHWWEVVAEKLDELKPFAVHVEHDVHLYEHANGDGQADPGRDFIQLLQAINHWPVVVEPHTIPGHLQDRDAEFLYQLCSEAHVVLFKRYYQKWRLDWTFPGMGWRTPTNIMIVPQGARPDRRYGIHEVPQLRAELGLDQVPRLATHLVGLVGWIPSDRRWDILTRMWEEIAGEILYRTGQDWDLLVAGAMQDPNHLDDNARFKDDVLALSAKGLAHFHEFQPCGDAWYKMMGVCDFLVLPTMDEVHSDALIRIIALNKPFVAGAPMEGPTTQTLESGGGLLFTSKKMLRDAVVQLACDEPLRLRFGAQLKSYLEDVVSWDRVVQQYHEAYEYARKAAFEGQAVDFPGEY
jgi:1,2-diacylglycerol 3-alpha-glucosyltransferase